VPGEFCPAKDEGIGLFPEILIVKAPEVAVPPTTLSIIIRVPVFTGQMPQSCEQVKQVSPPLQIWSPQKGCAVYSHWQEVRLQVSIVLGFGHTACIAYATAAL